MEALLAAKGLHGAWRWKPKIFMTISGTLTLKERDEIETKLDKALGIIQRFLDPTCTEIAKKMSGRH
jgi:hypothetical protein